MLVSFNNWNIIQFAHKATSSEYIDKIHQVVLEGITDNIATLVRNGQYGATNTTYTTAMVYYVIKFLPESYTL